MADASDCVSCAFEARPGVPPRERVYLPARWWHVLLWGDGVRLAVTVALLSVAATALTGFVAYRDHPNGAAAVLTLVVLIVTTIAAIINVFQQLA